MKNQTRTIRNLCIFILIALSCGWVGVWVDSLTGETTGDFSDTSNGTSGMGIFIVAPVLTWLLLRVFMGDGWRDAGLQPLIKKNLRWYGVAALIYPVVIALTLLIGELFGWLKVQIRWADYLSGFGIFILAEFVKNFFEESSWRGYLTARLLSSKIKDMWLYLIVGVVFPSEQVTLCIMALVCCTSWTVMYTELFRLTKSIWAGVWMHAIEDATINSLIYDKHILIETGKEILISPVSGIIPCLLYLGVGLWLRRIRINTQQANDEASF